MTYHAPVQDQLFVLNELAGLNDVLALPQYQEASPDVIEAVLQENARFVENELAPLNKRGDTEAARWSEGEVRTTPGYKEAYNAFVSGGWQGLQHSTSLGGQGLPKLLAACTTENLNAANLAFSLCPLLTDGVIEALATVGSEDLQQRFIPPLMQGRWTGTMNLTEPQAGSDLALITTRAVPQDDGSYRVAGQKIFITYGEHDLADNIVHLVLARTPDAPKGIKGISLFVVPKFLVNEDGSLGPRNDVWCASLEHKLGIHGSPTAVMVYGSGKGQVGEGAVAYLVGEENRGLQYMFIMMNAARYAVGVQGIAMSERALQAAEAYASERLQGQAPDSPEHPVAINWHPDVQRMLLTMRALTEGGRALALMAAAARDHWQAQADEGVRAHHQRLYEYLVPVIKGFSTENALEVTSVALQVHGGMGYVEETGIAQYYRDARILPIYEGTTAIQANDFVGRKILRDGGAVGHELGLAMRSTLAELELTAAANDPHSEQFGFLAQRFAEAISAYDRGLELLLEQGRYHMHAAFMGSVPALMLAGTVLAGWQMMRAALRAHERLEQGAHDMFYDRKWLSSLGYAAYVLPRAQQWVKGMESGDAIASTATEYFRG